MIGRDTSKASFAATGVLSLGLFLPATLTFSGTHIGTLTVDGTAKPYVTRAATVGQLLHERGIAVQSNDRLSAEASATLDKTHAVEVIHSHSVTFTSSGKSAVVESTARTVAEFLEEQNIHPSDDDFVSPDRQTLLNAVDSVEYRPAVSVLIHTGSTERRVSSAAANVSMLLYQQNITLGSNDLVFPSATTPLEADMVIRVTRVTAWTKVVQDRVEPSIERHLDFHLQPGKQKVIVAGRPGVRERIVRFVQREGEAAKSHLVAARIVRAPQKRIVAEGIGEYAAFAQLASRGFDSTLIIARSALSMVATAYTAGCYGCSGITATGQHAGHGIVAVDPRVIPLGTKLFIPGYGPAVAGDTGGAIVGNRIDLGFDSYADAIRFGRRDISVYVLR